MVSKPARFYANWQDTYKCHIAILWGNLSRFNNLLILMNISLFFLTGLVEKGYFYTFISLICLSIVGIGMLIPTSNIERLWYYLIYLLLESIAIFYLVSSIIFWVRTGYGDITPVSI